MERFLEGFILGFLVGGSVMGWKQIKEEESR